VFQYFSLLVVLQDDKTIEGYGCLSTSDLLSTTGLSTTTCGISLDSADARSGIPGIAIRLNNMDVVYKPKHIV
jgi:hypothetical protein